MSTQKLTIALDFDDTITSNQEMWEETILLWQERKDVRVVIVTFRNQDLDFTDTLQYFAALADEVYFTDGVAKEWYMKYRTNETVNIWVDDRPTSLVSNSTIPLDKLDEWRKTRL